MSSPTLGALITEIYVFTLFYKKRECGVEEWPSRYLIEQEGSGALSSTKSPPGSVLQFLPYNWSNNRKTIVTIS